MPNLVIIGTNYFQVDLVDKAHEMGFETHTFGVAVSPKNRRYECRRLLDLEGALVSDVYYPISILDIDGIVKRCQDIKPAGIMSVGSDLAVLSVNKVASALGLVCNTPKSALWSTNKYEMRCRFTMHSVPQPAWILVDKTFDPKELPFPLPVIVKAVDRSGKCGITKVERLDELKSAIKYGLNGAHLWKEHVLIEEYLEGKEYTAESISYQGEHHILTWTEKFSEAPNFVEEMHLQPAPLSEETIKRITPIIHRMLDSLGIKNGPAHCEFKFTEDGGIKIIETAARVVADWIWIAMKITTGVNWIEKSIDVAVGNGLNLDDYKPTGDCGVIKFIMTKEDHENFAWLQKNHPEKLVDVGHRIERFDGRKIKVNGMRYGCYGLRCSSREEAIALAKPKAK